MGTLRRTAALAASVVALSSIGASGAAQRGSIDRSFGGSRGGIVRTDLGRHEDARDLLRLAGGGLLAVGADAPSVRTPSTRLALVRHEESGRLDRRFGDAGTMHIPVRGDGFFAPVVPTPDGGFIVADRAAELGLRLRRFTSRGRLDPRFGTDGIVVDTRAPFGVGTLAVQPDGGIVTLSGASAGLAWTGPWLAGGTVMRFNPDGSPDPAFGIAGHAQPWSFAWPGGGLVPYHLTADASGNIIVTGQIWAGINPRGIWASRLTPNGVVDPTFGSGGLTVMPQVTMNLFRSKVSPRGEIVLLGWTYDRDRIVRLRPDGSPDPTFGTDGVVTMGFPDGGWITDVATTDTGGMYVMAHGPSCEYPCGPGTVIALDARGRVDRAFGRAGEATIPTDDISSAVATRRWLYVLGELYEWTDGSSDLALMRLYR